MVNLRRPARGVFLGDARWLFIYPEGTTNEHQSLSGVRVFTSARSRVVCRNILHDNSGACLSCVPYVLMMLGFAYDIIDLVH